MQLIFIQNAEGIQWAVHYLWNLLVKFPQMIANSSRQVTGWVSFLPPVSRGCKLQASKHWANLRKWLKNTFLSFQKL
jgi:hypothetical protein